LKKTAFKGFRRPENGHGLFYTAVETATRAGRRRCHGNDAVVVSMVAASVWNAIGLAVTRRSVAGAAAAVNIDTAVASTSAGQSILIAL